MGISRSAFTLYEKSSPSPTKVGETFYELCQALFKKYLTPPDVSSEEQYWPGGIFHHTVYGLATSQR